MRPDRLTSTHTHGMFLWSLVVVAICGFPQCLHLSFHLLTVIETCMYSSNNNFVQTIRRRMLCLGVPSARRAVLLAHTPLGFCPLVTTQFFTSQSSLNRPLLDSLFQRAATQCLTRFAHRSKQKPKHEINNNTPSPGPSFAPRTSDSPAPPFQPASHAPPLPPHLSLPTLPLPPTLASTLVRCPKAGPLESANAAPPPPTSLPTARCGVAGHPNT